MKTKLRNRGSPLKFHPSTGKPVMSDYKVADSLSPHLGRGEKEVERRFEPDKLGNPDETIEDNGSSRDAHMILKVSLRVWQCWINLKSRRVLQSFVLATILISLGFTVLTFRSYKSGQKQESHELTNTVFFKMDGEEKLVWEITEEKNIFEEDKDVTNLIYDIKVKHKDTLEVELKVGAEFNMNEEEALNGKDIDFVRREAEARDSEEGETSDSPDLIISNRILNDRLRGEDFFIRFNQNSEELFDIKK